MPKRKGTKLKKTTTKSGCPQWNEYDTAKLLKLFQTGAVDLKDISSTSIHDVINQYFPGRPYSSFSQLYKRKIHQFNIEQTKFGSRKGKMGRSFVNIYFESSTHNGLGAAIETKSKTASKSNSTIPSQIDYNESSEDETWIPTATTHDSEEKSFSADEESNLPDHYSIDLESTSNGDESKTSETEETITKFSNMTMRSYKETSFKFEYPFIIYPYKEARQKKVAIDFLVFNQQSNQFQCTFNKAGTQIFLQTKIPKLLMMKKRVMETDVTLADDTNKTVAFEEVIESVKEFKNAANDDDLDGIYGPPQVINLPYPCDTTIPIEHEMQGFEAWGVPNENHTV